MSAVQLRARTHSARGFGNSLLTSAVNRGRGAVQVPAMAAGATSTITINDSRITPSSRITTELVRGTTAPAAGATASVDTLVRTPTVGQVIIDVRNDGSAAVLNTDYVLLYTAS